MLPIQVTGVTGSTTAAVTVSGTTGPVAGSLVVVADGSDLFTIRGLGVVSDGSDLWTISPVLSLGGDLYQIVGSSYVSVSGSSSVLVSVSGGSS